MSCPAVVSIFLIKNSLHQRLKLETKAELQLCGRKRDVSNTFQASAFAFEVVIKNCKVIKHFLPLRLNFFASTRIDVE